MRTEQEVISVCHASCGTPSLSLTISMISLKKKTNQFYPLEGWLAAVGDTYCPYWFRGFKVIERSGPKKY